MTIFQRLLLAFSFLFFSACASNPNPPQSLLDNASEQTENSVASVYVQMGVEYMRLGKNSIALDNLHKALALDKSDIKAHNAIAILYERLGDLNQAEYHYQEALRYHPNDSASNSNYGSFVCRKAGVNAAEPYFLTAAANPLYKTPELPYTNAGICALYAEDLDKAAFFLGKALAANPNFDNAHYQMAVLKEKLGEYETAESYYLRYIDKQPQSAESLWLGIRISEALGQVDRASSYALLLKSRHPDSEQTQQLRQYLNQD